MRPIIIQPCTIEDRAASKLSRRDVMACRCEHLSSVIGGGLISGGLADLTTKLYMEGAVGSCRHPIWIGDNRLLQPHKSTTVLLINVFDFNFNSFSSSYKVVLCAFSPITQHSLTHSSSRGSKLAGLNLRASLQSSVDVALL